MKRTIIFILLATICILMVFAERDNQMYSLAEQIAGGMSGEPFVVRVAYGEVILRGEEEAKRRATPSISDIRAAAAALCGYDFSCGALKVIRWKKAESTPLEMRSGVRLYGWFFYI